VEDFCYITDNTYQHGQVLEMEREVLKTLGFNLSTPTVKTFVIRYLKAADSTPGDKLDCLASFLAELTLLEYSFLPYMPSMVAASAIMLARYTLNRPPWTTTLEHYAEYTTQDLKPCVLALHQVCARGPSLPPLCSLAPKPLPGELRGTRALRCRVTSAHPVHRWARALHPQLGISKCSHSASE
jgi:cyclin A